MYFKIAFAAINFGAVMLATPFENRIEVFELKGIHVLEMLEYSVANIPFAGARMLQTSGNVLIEWLKFNLR